MYFQYDIVEELILVIQAVVQFVTKRNLKVLLELSKILFFNNTHQPVLS